MGRAGRTAQLASNAIGASFNASYCVSHALPKATSGGVGASAKQGPNKAEPLRACLSAAHECRSMAAPARRMWHQVNTCTRSRFRYPVTLTWSMARRGFSSRSPQRCARGGGNGGGRGEGGGDWHAAWGCWSRRVLPRPTLQCRGAAPHHMPQHTQGGLLPKAR